MDCFDSAWNYNNIQDLKLDISGSGKAPGYWNATSQVAKQLGRGFADQNKAIKTWWNIAMLGFDVLGGLYNLTSKAFEGSQITADQKMRLKEEDSQINLLIRSMKNMKIRIDSDIKGLEAQSKIYINSLPKSWKEIFLDLECPSTTSSMTNNLTALVGSFEKNFKNTVADYYSHYTLQNIIDYGPNIIMAHCRASITQAEARKKITTYLSEPCAIAIKKSWHTKLNKKCVEKLNGQLQNNICPSFRP